MAVREVMVLWAGRHDREPWRSLCADYEQRIAHHWRIAQRQIRAGRGDGPERREAEAEAMLSAAPEPASLLALDSRGRARSSESFADFLRQTFESSPGPLVFLIGSDLGLSPDLLRTARHRISFGPQTLPHEMARLILLEQLYRSLAIETGIKYHRGPF
ncbi:MAG: 23S rRNA (pseudouridine(1915)-N(3))-methyltransferase RlmH [Acidobacteria bacterium]|nr:MAG: 23S rRNA (pseudouridine(1915)-N(3))-methyltransferase RlmH [Acidobacteriota bacterium]REK10139.1 MAG: 23S rRNA (pseudouridine(1915)-N(3))-methyltransferase RlmH [Acidobacteriota bacterium]